MLCVIVCVVFMFFFVKQKTAYEMRISDWSSDVFSSDLQSLQHARELQQLKVRELDQINRQLGEFDAREQRERQRLEEAARQLTELEQPALSAEEHETATQSTLIESEDDEHEEQRRWDSRSEERRAGDERVSPYRSRWSPHHQPKNKN